MAHGGGGDNDWYEPVFVDTVLSDDEAPHRSTSLAILSGAVGLAVAGLLVFALTTEAGEDDPDAAESAAPVEPTPTPTPTPETVTAVTARGENEPVDRRYLVTLDGDEFCLDAENEQLSTFSTTCAPLDDGPFRRGVVTVGDGRNGLWCLATAVGSEVTEVTIDYTDDTWSRLDLAPMSARGVAFGAACRADGVGVTGLHLWRDDERLDEGGDGTDVAIPARPGGEPPAAAFGVVPPGWVRFQIGRFTFVSNVRLEVAAGPPDDRTCETPELDVASQLPVGAVVVSAVALDGLVDAPERDGLVDLQPAELAPILDSCLDPADRPSVRTARFVDQGRPVQVSVLSRAAPDDPAVAQAEAMLQTVTVLPSFRRASEDPSPTVPLASLGAQGAWTGEEVLLWGGHQYYRSSVFDPDLTIVERLEGGRRHPIGGAPSQRGALYDPASDTWRPMAVPPPEIALGPSPQGTVWTGEELLVWSNDTARGAAYDPGTDTWRQLPGPTATEGRLQMAATELLWTGSEVLVFGQFHGPSSVRPEAFAAVYSPAADTWRPLAPPSDEFWPVSAGVWTGTEAVVFDYRSGFAHVLDLEAHRWRSVPVPVDPNGEAVVVGRAYWDGEGIVAFGFEVDANTRIGRVYLSQPPFDEWRDEDFPPTTVTGVETVEVDDGILAVSPVIDATTSARGAFAAYLRRHADGVAVPVELPDDWNRCFSTGVGFPGGVLFWGGTTCDQRALGDTDQLRSAVVVDLPG